MVSTFVTVDVDSTVTVPGAWLNESTQSMLSPLSDSRYVPAADVFTSAVIDLGFDTTQGVPCSHLLFQTSNEAETADAASEVSARKVNVPEWLLDRLPNVATPFTAVAVVPEKKASAVVPGGGISLDGTEEEATARVIVPENEVTS
jgi:hypothetical protein